MGNGICYISLIAWIFLSISHAADGLHIRKHKVNESDEDILNFNFNFTRRTSSVLLLTAEYDPHVPSIKYPLCELISWKEIKDNKDFPYIKSQDCYDKNTKDGTPTMMYFGGVAHYPFVAFSKGHNGKIAACPKPQNTTLFNCTNENFVYSVCNFECSGESPGTAICKLTGYVHNLTTQWSYKECNQETESSIVVLSHNLVKDKKPKYKERPKAVGLPGHANESDVHKDRGSSYQAENASLLNFLYLLFLIPVIGLAVCCYRFGLVKKCKQELTFRFPDTEKGKDAEEMQALDVNANRNAGGGTDSQPSNQSEAEDDEHAGEESSERQEALPDLPTRHHGDDIGSGYSVKCDGQDDAGVINLPSEMDMGSLKDLNDAASAVQCNTSVKILLEQPYDYLSGFIELFEVLNTKENTMKGLALKIYKDIGFQTIRGVDVFQHTELKRGNNPSTMFLERLAEYGIVIGVLLDYFQGNDQIDYIMKAHPDCQYCNIQAKRKNANKLQHSRLCNNIL